MDDETWFFFNTINLNKLQKHFFESPFKFFSSSNVRENITVVQKINSPCLFIHVFFNILKVFRQPISKTNNFDSLSYFFNHGKFTATECIMFIFSAFSTHIFDYPTLDGYVTNKVLRFTTHVGIYSGLIWICLPPQRNTLIWTNMHFIT